MALLRKGISYLPSLVPKAEICGASLVNIRPYASYKSGREEAVVVTDDGKTIVCWHPEPVIPYELTMPLPEAPLECDSVLKVQNSNEMKKLFRHQHPFFISKELQELTFTTKHPWFPRPGRRFAKRNPPRDREYL